MTDNRITVTFNFYHSQADPNAIMPMIERLRRKAIDLGFLRVSDLHFHTSQAGILSSEYGKRFLIPELKTVPTIPTAVCYFKGSLSDCKPMEVGLAYHSCAVVIYGHVVPYGPPTWMWTEKTKTRNLKTLSKLLYHAAEIGVMSFTSFAGMSMVYSPGNSGRVLVEQEWDEFPDAC